MTVLQVEWTGKRSSSLGGLGSWSGDRKLTRRQGLLTFSSLFRLTGSLNVSLLQSLVDTTVKAPLTSIMSTQKKAECVLTRQHMSVLCSKSLGFQTTTFCSWHACYLVSGRTMARDAAAIPTPDMVQRRLSEDVLLVVLALSLLSCCHDAWTSQEKSLYAGCGRLSSSPIATFWLEFLLTGRCWWWITRPTAVTHGHLACCTASLDREKPERLQEIAICIEKDRVCTDLSRHTLTCIWATPSWSGLLHSTVCTQALHWWSRLQIDIFLLYTPRTLILSFPQHMLCKPQSMLDDPFHVHVRDSRWQVSVKHVKTSTCTTEGLTPAWYRWLQGKSEKVWKQTRGREDRGRIEGTV